MAKPAGPQRRWMRLDLKVSKYFSIPSATWQVRLSRYSTQFGRWIIYGVRTGKHNALPAEALWPMIEKNISLIGFNLEGSLQHVPRALGELFKFVIDGSVKIEITKYPLAAASIVHTLFEERKTTGKLVLLP